MDTSSTRNEDSRLDALRQLNLLDTPPSESFDRITRMASQIFDLPIAAISLTDSDRQWFKSRVGIDHWSIPRDGAPCARVAERAETVLIPDILADRDFADSILARQGVRFYAGAPLTTRDGFSLGALCVLGTEPRTATEAEMAGLNDLAQIVMAQIELQHAFGRIDPLSGLPNRTQFLDDLDDLGRDDPGRRRTAVLVELGCAEQLDAGVRVMGTGYVDDMVREAARRLRQELGPDRMGYHVAATQFAFLALPDIDEDAYATRLASTLKTCCAQSPVRFVMTTTIGITHFVTGVTSARDVLRTVHSAVLDARASETSVSVYSPAKDDAHQRQFELLNAFGAALDTGDQLRLVFQPRIDLTTQRCVGAEALLRWSHPTLGDVSPAEFIPIIERTSLARSTTALVLNTGLKQLAAWRARGINITLSLNVSAANLEETDFVERVQLYLLKHRVPPAMLELEVTESAVMEKSGLALSQLAALDSIGIRIAIDDFGTGYSSLAYLQRLPAKIVKIDRSFILDLETGERERALVRSMISLSHDLGYRVVAEGVETAAAAKILKDMGCDEAQGYYFAYPMEADDLPAWLFDKSAPSRAA